MKSKKAKEYIDNNLVKIYNGDVVVDVLSAYQAIDIAEHEILSALLPRMRELDATFDDLVKVYPALKNERLFTEVKELLRKYEM